jgi:hypothetical protein
MDEAAESPSAALLRLVNGYQVSQAIHVAATLGLADRLADGPQTSDDLAAATDTHPPALYRLLRALASVGILREEAHRRFALTPLGDGLRSDAPESLAAWAAFVGRPYGWQAWAHLPHSVQTGENAFRHAHGVGIWEYRAAHPEEGAVFDQAMVGLSRRISAGVLRAVDFGRFRTVVDVGGGHGGLLAAILAAHPAPRGILFDQPHVLAGAEPTLRSAGVADRCRLVAGSFFEAVPDGADAYVLKSILHDWEDDEAVAILRVCRRAIGSDGALLLVERVVGPPNEGAPAKFSDLNMLVGPGGRERTSDEFGQLLAAAGFQLVRVADAGAFGVVEGRPV